MTSDFISELILLAPPLLLALTLHEYAHGYVANRLGDPTAQLSGRLTLNPLRHLDPIGTIAFFFIKLGWAKPVPINAAYFKNPQKDMIWVALAGPFTNLTLAVISAVVAKLVLLLVVTVLFPYPVFIKTVISPFLGMVVASVWINLVLCIFNLLPIPPLDGSRILMGILPPKMAAKYLSYERYGFIIILVLVFTGVLPNLIGPVIRFANSLLLSSLIPPP